MAERFAKGGVVKADAMRCPDGRCIADEQAAKQLKDCPSLPFVERYCLCNRDREWVGRRDS